MSHSMRVGTLTDEMERNHGDRVTPTVPVVDATILKGCWRTSIISTQAQAAMLSPYALAWPRPAYWGLNPTRFADGRADYGRLGAWR